MYRSELRFGGEVAEQRFRLCALKGARHNAMVSVPRHDS
jgi:hypothetical protein